MKIQTINSIEISSVCDNQCKWCPAPIQHKYRETGFMDMETFAQTIKWIKYFANKGTQQEVNLFGVGEPTLNPDILALVEYARLNLPPRIPLHLNTNGNTMTEELARGLKNAGINSMHVTIHTNHEAAAKTIRIFRKVEIPFAVSVDAVLNPNNWAGQVDWFEPTYKLGPCPWIGRGQIMVMSNGQITRCCIDAFAKGALGKINDELIQIDVTPFNLCNSCHHTLS